MKKNEIIAGLFGGLATIGLMALVHAMEPRWMLHSGIYWGSLILYFLAMLGACLLEKRQGNGILPFRNAVRTAFVTFLIANALYYIFYLLMFNWIDPDLVLVQKELYREYYEQLLSGMDLRRKLEELEGQSFAADKGTAILGFCYGAIGGFISSLLVALGVRQEA